jgi:excisionase family DNA binding protein
MSDTDTMTTAEAAQVLGVSTKTVVRMAEDGRLTPHRKLPGLRGTYLFLRAEVKRYAAQQDGARAS